MTNDRFRYALNYYEKNALKRAVSQLVKNIISDIDKHDELFIVDQSITLNGEKRKIKINLTIEMEE